MTAVASVFHDGELLVQQRAGLTDEAARLVGMLARPQPDGRWTAFFAERRFAVLTARGVDGRLWVVPLSGPAGFLDAHGTTLAVAALPDPAGPLAKLPPGQNVGLIAVEFGTARRMRLNGSLVDVGAGGLVIEADEVFGNCPAHIRNRTLSEFLDDAEQDRETPVTAELSAEQRRTVERADTFFLGTLHPDRGADASHKGGRPGLVTVEGTELWWPDLAGNNMFNSLGNLAVNDEAALLFLDFPAGQALHLSGRARLDWIAPGTPGDDDSTGRRVRFEVERIAQHGVPVRARH